MAICGDGRMFAYAPRRTSRNCSTADACPVRIAIDRPWLRLPHFTYTITSLFHVSVVLIALVRSLPDSRNALRNRGTAR